MSDHAGDESEWFVSTGASPADWVWNENRKLSEFLAAMVRPHWSDDEMFELAGQYVMITNFCDFRQFSAKSLTFRSKTNVIIKFLQKVAVVWAKNANIFARFFGENILKFITSVPGQMLRSRSFDAQTLPKELSDNWRIFKPALNKPYRGALAALRQGCQMVYFQTKNPNLENFWRALDLKK
jgi:hypothetical protein